MRLKILGILLLVLIFTIVAYKCVIRNDGATRTYMQGLKKITTKDNPFYPEAQVAYFDSLESKAGSYDKAPLRYLKAAALIRVGQEKQAIEILEGLIGHQTAASGDALFVRAQKQLALAYLRLGERSNCIANHNSGSCVFPIRGGGVYTDPTASLKAIKTYEAILAGSASDLESRWLLNIAYMTIGEYPDKVPPALLIPGLDQDSAADKVKPFREAAGDLGLNKERNDAGGTIADDFNNDGYLDLVTTDWDLDKSMHYYRNNGDGTFTDVTKEAGLSGIKGGLNMIQADYNNDGFTDILILRGAWMGQQGKQPVTLLRNNGDGTFTDVTVESGILSLHPTQTATWADFNNDGWVDLFIGNETISSADPNFSELFINNGDGTFTNVADQAGCSKLFFMKGVTSADYNKDGWPDIFISGRDGKKMLLKNKGIAGKIPQFEDVTHEAGLDKEQTFTFPTWFWDYDNDGWPDIFVCGYSSDVSFANVAAREALHLPLSSAVTRMYLYHNNHDGTFTDVSKEMGLDRPVFAMGSNFGDIDNDGWLDMYLGTGNPDFTSLIPNRLFKNLGGKGFEDVTASARVGNLQKGHGVAFADFDNDGNQDIFIETGGALPGDVYYNSLYLNPGQNDNNNWISVLLKGTKSNHSAIGAHIEVKFQEDGKERTVYMDVNSGGSFGCNPFRKEIGIGGAKMIDSLVIRWPTSGTVQVFKDITPRQFLTIEEGSDKVVKVNLKRLYFRPGKGMGHMDGMGGMDMNMKVIGCGPDAK